MHTFASCGSVVLTVLAALAAPAAAAPYRNAGYHFQLEIPPGWRAMTDAEWQTVLDGTKGKLVGGKPVVLVAGFRPEEGGETGPKVIVHAQEAPWGPSDTRAKIERDVGKGIGMPIVLADGDFSALVRIAGDGRGALDWRRVRLVFVKDLAADPEAKVRMAAAMQFSKAGAVNIFCYSAADDFEKDLTAYRAFNDSFAFDDGFGYQPPAEETLAFQIGKIIGYLMCWSLPIILVVVLSVAYSRRRSRSPRRRRRRELDGEDRQD